MYSLLHIKQHFLSKLVIALCITVTVFTPFLLPLSVSADPKDPATYEPPSATVSTNAQNKPDANSALASCSISDPVGCIEALMQFLLVEVTAFFAGIAGLFFDFATALSIDGGIYSSQFISKAWTIARDLANMAFVFLLIYVAFTLILDIAHSGVGKTLAKIIAVALLINFSFFFTRVVIDASNILSHAFYDNIRGRALAGAGNALTAGGQPLQIKSLSENILAGINPQNLYNDTNPNGFRAFVDEIRQNATRGGKTALLIGIFIAFAIINILLIFIFFAAGIQMVGRIVRLWLVIMLSPLGFIAWIIPGLGGMSKRWWEALLQSAFFAPAFLLGLYIIITIVTEGNLLGRISFGSVTPGAPAYQIAQGIIVVFLRLAIVIGLLFAALKLGDYFGQTSSKAILGQARKYGGKPLGMAYSWTGGAIARGVDDRFKNSEWANRNRLLGYKVRQYTTKPLAGASIGGAESAVSRKDRIGKEKTEMAAGLRDIQNKKAMALVKDTQSKDAFKAIPEPEKKLVTNFTENASQRELESFKSSDLQSFAHVLSDSSIKKIESSTKYTEEEKTKIRDAWQKRTANAGGAIGKNDAPINKADDAIDDLHKINEELPDTMKPIIGEAFKKDSHITTKKISDTSDALNKQTTAQNEIIRNIRNDTTLTSSEKIEKIVVHQTNIENITKAKKTLETLKEKIKEVPAGVGAPVARVAGERPLVLQNGNPPPPTGAGEMYAGPVRTRSAGASALPTRTPASAPASVSGTSGQISTPTPGVVANPGIQRTLGNQTAQAGQVFSNRRSNVQLNPMGGAPLQRTVGNQGSASGVAQPQTGQLPGNQPQNNTPRPTAPAPSVVVPVVGSGTQIHRPAQSYSGTAHPPNGPIVPQPGPAVVPPTPQGPNNPRGNRGGSPTNRGPISPTP